MKKKGNPALEHFDTFDELFHTLVKGTGKNIQKKLLVEISQTGGDRIYNILRVGVGGLDRGDENVPLLMTVACAKEVKGEHKEALAILLTAGLKNKEAAARIGKILLALPLEISVSPLVFATKTDSRRAAAMKIFEKMDADRLIPLLRKIEKGCPDRCDAAGNVLGKIEARELIKNGGGSFSPTGGKGVRIYSSLQDPILNPKIVTQWGSMRVPLQTRPQRLNRLLA